MVVVGRTPLNVESSWYLTSYLLLSTLPFIALSAATAGCHQLLVCPPAKSKGYPCDLVSRLDFRRFSSPILVFKELLKTVLGDLSGLYL